MAGVIRVLAQVPGMRESNPGASEHAILHIILFAGVPPSLHISLRHHYKSYFKRLKFSAMLAEQSPMTEYNLTPPTTLPSLAVLDAKEKRRKVLEAVRHRRKLIYARF